MTDAAYLRERAASRFLRYVLLALIMLALLFPFVEMLSTSLKQRQTLYSWPPTWFPSAPAWNNFVAVWYEVPLGLYFWNSVVIVGGATLLSTLVGIPAGFALARLRFPGRQLFLHFIIGTQMFSPVVLLLALFLMLNFMHLLDTHLALVLINAATALPFTIWMMTAYFSSVPLEIEEAAIIDGASRTRIMISLFIPIAAPGIATTMTFSFVNAWNEFLLALTFLSDARLRPLTTGIYSFVGRYEIQWHYLLAASLIAIVPVFAGFLLVQRRLVAGLAAGAVK